MSRIIDNKNWTLLEEINTGNRRRRNNDWGENILDRNILGGNVFEKKKYRKNTRNGGKTGIGRRQMRRGWSKQETTKGWKR